MSISYESKQVNEFIEFAYFFQIPIEQYLSTGAENSHTLLYELWF